MPQHATPANVQALAFITADAASALATTTALIRSQSFEIADQPLLDATFSDLASRLDDITRMVDQYDNLTKALDKALHPPEVPTTPVP